MSVGDESERHPSDQQTTWTAQLQAPGNAHSRSSNAPLIYDLPQVLFVKIIEEVYRLSKREGTLRLGTDWTNPYRLVCLRWRDVICSTPQFWQEICPTRSPEWLELCLARRADTLVTVDVRTSFCSSATFATLCRHALSLKECCADFDADDMEWLSGLSSLLATPTPALQKLTISGRYHNIVHDSATVTHDLVPRLTTLNLHISVAPRDAMVYASLRQLILLDSTWTTSYADFLDVLSTCRALEFLRVENQVIHLFEYDLQVLNPIKKHQNSSSTPVVLPELRVLKLSGPTPVVCRLLSAIHAPQATTVKFSNVLDPDEDEYGPNLARLLAPNPEQRYPFLSSPTFISIACWDGAHFGLNIRDVPGKNQMLYSLDSRANHFVSWNRYLSRNLTAIVDIFPVTSVETLQVEGRLDRVPADVWQRVFQAFSNLRTLHLKGQGTLDSFWLGLSRATLASVEGGGAVCCPSLSEITTEARSGSGYGFAATTTLFDLVRGAIDARVAHCSDPLKKLKLRLLYSKSVWNQTAELRDAFVEDVRALVGELEYHEGRAK